MVAAVPAIAIGPMSHASDGVVPRQLRKRPESSSGGLDIAISGPQSLLTFDCKRDLFSLY
jgi:hypothetical protein